MRVLGIDPGTVRMGYGLVEEADDLVMEECGVLEAPARQPIEYRLLTLHTQLRDLVERMRPSAMAIEEPFVVHSPRNSAMAVGEARAIAMLAAAGLDVPVFQYSPPKVRRTIANYGASDKEQVRQMVGLLLRRPMDGYSLDACDALAVAICHLREARLAALVDQQSTGQPGRMVGRAPSKRRSG